MLKKILRSVFFMLACGLLAIGIYIVYTELNTSYYMKNNSSDKLKIYQIDRETFNSFIEESSLQVLTVGARNKVFYLQHNDWYITHSNTRFLIEEELLDFVRDKKGIESFLLEKGINTNVLDVVIFEAPYVPITVCTITDTSSIYITVNESVEDKGYVYRLYSSMEYYEKFHCKEARLVINGDTVATDTLTKMYYGYADVSLVPILKCLGAEVIRVNDELTSIDINDKRYYLNIKEKFLYENGYESINLLFQVNGSPIFVYNIKNDLIVDTATLSLVLHNMGEKVFIQFDVENSTVSIETDKTGDGS
ncbi:MAG: hypothetical protein IKU41_03475 [Clostridia bacterium]|nr:hypothetical protein [Clostridia bacterium]